MILSLDIETTGLDYFKDEILCIGVFSPEIGYKSFDTVDSFRDYHDTRNRYICHNGSFDISWLRHHGLDLRANFHFDTRSLATILVPTPHLAKDQKRVYSLENLYQVLLNGSAYKEDRTKMAELSKERLLAYNEKDCRITYELFEYIVQALDDADWAFAEAWVMPATKLLMDVSYNGVSVDEEKLKAYRTQIEGELNGTQKEIEKITEEPRQKFQALEVEKLRASYHELYLLRASKSRNPAALEKRYGLLFEKAKSKLPPFNLNSSTQLKWLLKDFYGLDLFNKRSQKETTDEAMLKEHAGKVPLCEKLVKHRELQKLTSTCIPALLDHIAPDHRIHPYFTIGGTRTGRISSSNPNFQQVPKGYLRTCVIPKENHSFFIADYAQIEVRVLAHLANEKELIDGFKEGIDCYSIIAKRLLGLEAEVQEIKERYPKERNVSKTAGLSIIYGTGAQKLREVLSRELGNELSLKQCKQFITDYRDNFPAIKSYKSSLEQKLANQKKIYGLLGRPVYIHSNDDLYMKALNTVVQGSASDLVLAAVDSICKTFSFIKPVLVVHDEMVLEIEDKHLCEELYEEIERLATTEIERKLNLLVPLKIEFQTSKAWMKP